MLVLPKLQNSPTEMGNELKWEKKASGTRVLFGTDVFNPKTLISGSASSGVKTLCLSPANTCKVSSAQVLPAGSHEIHIPQVLGGLQSQGFAGAAALYYCGSVSPENEEI